MNVDLIAFLPVKVTYDHHPSLRLSEPCLVMRNTKSLKVTIAVPRTTYSVEHSLD